ncbi:MAG: SDR family NAD(P)-dependent oxidoreductase [Spirochaetes bacterium]|nr:MAG: SDR family NAD(P)-dependent oxidoreductase [Spirochaetota bacterium]
MPISIDYRDRVVLVTGGTKGIGLATALEFGRAGARLYITYKWGSADTEELFDAFREAGAEKPVLIQADASVSEDTDTLMEEIGKLENSIDVYINNVGFALRTETIEDYKKRSLFKTLEYSTWPIVEYSRKIKERFGKYPKYIVGISSNGPDHFYRGYDFVAASKALLEFFSRYLSVHLFEEGSRVNVLRFGMVRTESFEAIFGSEFFDFLKDQGVTEKMILSPEDCGRAVLALCSGLMDAVNGQIINVDYGLPFMDNSMIRYLQFKKK